MVLSAKPERVRAAQSRIEPFSASFVERLAQFGIPHASPIDISGEYSKANLGKGTSMKRNSRLAGVYGIITLAFALVASPASAEGTSGAGTGGVGVSPGTNNSAGTAGLGTNNGVGGVGTGSGLNSQSRTSCTDISSELPCNQQAGTADTSPSGLPTNQRAGSLSGTVSGSSSPDHSLNNTGSVNTN